MKLAVVLAGAYLFAASPAVAQEGLPFPELDTKAFCTELVAKMLNPEEKSAEYSKCLIEEAQAKAASKRFWGIVDPRQQRQILTHFREPKHGTYNTVAAYVGQTVGRACLAGELVCR